MDPVTGIGGVFVHAHDPGRLQRWYADHLGVPPPPESYDQSSWWPEAGPTVVAAMGATPGHVDPDHPWSLGFRVRDLQATMDSLRRAGVAVEADPETYPNGRFAALLDPEGNAVQLWQPAGADAEGAPGTAAQVVARAEERAAALVRGDVAALHELLHPDFGWTSHTGERLDRAAYVARNTGGTTRWRSQTLERPAVVGHGDAAVLTCTVRDVVLTGAAEGGGEAAAAGEQERVLAMTQVWVRSGGRWVCLAGHAGPEPTARSG